MAERRMFAKTIIDSDAFMDMPASSQLLYFHLSMRADDEGFLNNPRRIERLIGASDDDMKVLIAKRFIIPFESGVVVIKHWRIHNYIQKDRFKPTVYADERSMLTIKSNGAYTESAELSEENSNVYSLDTKCIQNVYNLDTQDSIGKDSIDKYNSQSVIKEKIKNINNNKNKINRQTDYPYLDLSDEQIASLERAFPDTAKGRMLYLNEYIQRTGKRYSDHYALLLNDLKKADLLQTQKSRTSSFVSDVESHKYTDEDYNNMFDNFGG